MRRSIQDIIYAPLYGLFYLLALLPLPVLYVIANFIYFIVYRVVRYRVKVVRDNLKQSFPQKNEEALLGIEKDFYRHFANYMVETIKLLHISDAEMRRRMEFVDAEVVDRFITQGRSVMLLLGHYGNWEWIPSLTMWCAAPPQLQPGQVYRPLRNEWFDRFFLRLRSHFGTKCVPKNDIYRVLSGYRREGKVSLTGFMADQTPSPQNIHHWVSLFNRPTAAITGFEKVAKKLDMAVVYIDVEILRRGYYRATFQLLEENPTQVPEFDITNRYYAALQRTLDRAPYAWLWSHKRWKHTPSSNTTI